MASVPRAVELDIDAVLVLEPHAAKSVMAAAAANRFGTVNMRISWRAQTVVV